MKYLETPQISRISQIGLGTGRFGSVLSEDISFKMLGIIPKSVIDRSIALRGGRWRGITVLNPDDVSDRDTETIICNSNKSVCDSTKDSLQLQGFVNLLSIYEFASREEN